MELDVFSEKKPFEKEFLRCTFYVRKDLSEKVNELSKGKKGYKTWLVNSALKEYLKSIN